MKNGFNHQPPTIDPDSLNENYEIRMDYDSAGNLVRIRKVRSDAGCAVWVALTFIAILIVLAKYLFFDP